jgi:hypothetical protein
MSGQAKSFQAPMKVRSTRTAISGRLSGSTIWTNVRSVPAPSTRAASSSSSGIARKNCRARKIPKTVALVGRTTDHSEPYRPRSMTRSNCGTMIAWIGIIIVESSSRNSAVRPLNGILAKAYPASRLTAVVMAVTSRAMVRELRNHVPTGNACSGVVKFSSVGRCGHRCRPGA